ncbi:hypothetical protein [Kitasatospora sp. NPDC001527]|uniref:hypothetical protein n=1 Tax=Kitasatospora sp. NPDC001527 TaxID=3154519 RepID=UPI0033261B3B
MVLDGTGGVLEDGEGWHQHESDAVRTQSSWQAACQIMGDAAGECGGLWDTYGEGIIHDAGSFLAADAGRRITDSLAGYPLLDEDDHSAREWAAMVEEIEGSPLALPDGVDSEDVLRKLSCPSLGEITMSMVEDVLSGTGYAECSDCSEWLAPMAQDRRAPGVRSRRPHARRRPPPASTSETRPRPERRPPTGARRP